MCGKTTTAKAFSETFDYDFIDTDRLIIDYFIKTQNVYCSISDIYRAIGQLEFRKLEEKVISEISRVERTILSTGGGAVLNATNVKRLKELGKIIYLSVGRKTLKKRLLKNYETIGFLSGSDREDEIQAYLSSRQGIYESVADKIINVDKKTVNEVVFEINNLWSS